MSLSSTLSSFGLLRSTVQSRLTGWIGIDIGTSGLRIAQVKKTGPGWKLNNHVTVPFDSETEPQDLIQSVCQILKQQPALFSLFAGRKAAFMLPMSLVEMQSMKLPAGSDEELRMMVQQELADAGSPRDGEKEFAFWQDRFATNPKSEMAEIVVMSSDQQNILTVAQQLQKSSCQCEVMNVLPFALARAVKMVSISSMTEPVAIFDWGTSSPMFIIVKNGFPVFSRLFRNCGYAKFTHPLREHMGLTPAESRRLLKVYQSTESEDALSSAAQKAIADRIAAPLKQLAHEFSRTLQFIKQQQSDFFPTHLWLAGTGTEFDCIERTFYKMTELPCSLWKLPGKTTVQKEETILQSKLAPAIALSSLAYEL